MPIDSRIIREMILATGYFSVVIMFAFSRHTVSDYIGVYAGCLAMLFFAYKLRGEKGFVAKVFLNQDFWNKAREKRGKTQVELKKP